MTSVLTVLVDFPTVFAAAPKCFVFPDLFVSEAVSFLSLNAYRFVPGKSCQALTPTPGQSALRSVPIPYLLLPVSFLIAFH